MSSSRKRRKRRRNTKVNGYNNTVTVNITPYLVKVLKAVTVLYLVCALSFFLEHNRLPYVMGYSIYRSSVDYADYDIKEGQWLVVKESISLADKSGIYLNSDGRRKYQLSKEKNENTIGVIAHKINIFEDTVKFFNNIKSYFNRWLFFS